MELSAQQLALVEKLGQWVKKEAGFKGRTESDFLVMFLRSCNFDEDLTKKTMCFFYQNRLKYPMWWARRDLRNPCTYNVLRSSIGVILNSNRTDVPLVEVIRLSNVGSHARVMDDIWRVGSLIAEIGMRKTRCQLNGVVLVVDFFGCPTWFVKRFLKASTCSDLVHSFTRAMPIRIKHVVFLNCTPVCLAAIRVILFVSPQSTKNFLHCFGTKLSKLGGVVPLELLPEEYGGSAGPMKEHEEVFVEQVFSFNDYFLDDLKFGYQK